MNIFYMIAPLLYSSCIALSVYFLSWTNWESGWLWGMLAFVIYLSINHLVERICFELRRKEIER